MERLNLRILTLRDSEGVFKHFSDEEIIAFHIEDLGCRWGLFDKNDNSLIGTCGFHYLRNTNDDFTAEVGFDLSKQRWGRGLMVKARLLFD
ncbi:GNAT family N-acetyltransferase [Paenibacillus herberti]